MQGDLMDIPVDRIKQTFPRYAKGGLRSEHQLFYCYPEMEPDTVTQV